MNNEGLPYIAWHNAPGPDNSARIITTTFATTAEATGFTWEYEQAWSAGSGDDLRVVPLVLSSTEGTGSKPPALHMIYSRRDIEGQLYEIYYEYMEAETGLPPADLCGEDGCFTYLPLLLRTG